MATNDTTLPLRRAGDVDIIEASIYTSTNSVSGEGLTNPVYVDVKLFISELNLFEDMFGPGLYGNILMIDAANLIGAMKLTGDEWLSLKIKTPTMDDDAALINKMFRIYSITERQMVSDAGKQSYIMHFCSPEILKDALSPIYKTFKGPVQKVVQEIFENYIATTRTAKGGDVTPVLIIPPTQNEVKFTSPGWRPIQCLNWLASRTLAANYKNPGYLFFETNKSFRFANVEALIDIAIQNKTVYQEYRFTPKKLSSNPDNPNVDYTQDINVEYGKVEDMQVIENYNFLKNLQNGYYANKLFTLDVVTKQYDIHTYSHVDSYGQYKHLENIGGLTDCAPFTQLVDNDPNGYLMFYPKHSGLYSDFGAANVSDTITQTLAPRTSTLNELNNFKVEITVPGRTDIEVGAVIYYYVPDSSPRDETNKFEERLDPMLSGYYLVTAIRHKFTLASHVMILEIVRDSLNKGNS